MKKVIEAENMCCKRCADCVEKKLLLLDGVKGARAKFKKGIIYVESELSDDALISCVEDAGFHVKSISVRKSIF